MRRYPRAPFTFSLAAVGRRPRVRLSALSVVGAAFAGFAHPAAAQSQYFTNVLTTGSAYSWDAANWSVPGGTSSGPFASNWSAGDFARLYGVSASSYTVTVGADESMAGMYLNTGTTAVSLTIGQSNASGDLDVTSGIQGFIGTTGDTITINAPITGAGGIEPEVTSGNLYLNAINTYKGGTTLNYSSNLVYFNNGSAFGIGGMNVNMSSATGYAPLLATAGATTTIANNWTMTQGGVNFAANANTPVVATGTWNLVNTANSSFIRNNGSSSSPLTLSGAISGGSGANLVFSGANGGSIVVSGANTYTGTTTLGVTGATNFTFKLGAANTIASTASLILAGGTLNPGGFSQTMSGTTLGMTVSSTVDFGAGASTLDFANSSALTWTSGTVLNLVNYNAGLDALQFGTDATGLSAAELSHIEFNGTGLGTAALNANGLLVSSASAAPEPSVWTLIGAGALGGLPSVRRRARKP